MRDQRSSEVANGAGKVGQGRRKGIERQRGKGTNCRAQINYKLFKCTNKHWLEDEGPWSPGSLIIRIGIRGTISAGLIDL